MVHAEHTALVAEVQTVLEKNPRLQIKHGEHTASVDLVHATEVYVAPLPHGLHVEHVDAPDIEL
jgi:hypothetical protein